MGTKVNRGGYKPELNQRDMLKDTYTRLNKKFRITYRELQAFEKTLRQAVQKSEEYIAYGMEDVVLYVPRYKYNVISKFTDRAQMASYNRSYKRFLSPDYEAMISEEKRQQLRENIRELVDEAGANALIKVFDAMDDREYIAFFKQHSSIEALTYDSERSKYTGERKGLIDLQTDNVGELLSNMLAYSGY